MQTPEWKLLEELVARIQKQLSPDAEVTHNAKIVGRHSERERQIDVLVRQPVGQYAITIVIDCKDYKNPVDVKGVEEFQGLLEDVGAHKGVLVCPGGFTGTAKKRAKRAGIELYRPVDTGTHKWKVAVSVPATCSVYSCDIALQLSGSSPCPMRISDSASDWEAFSADGVYLGKPLDQALENWESGVYNLDPGEHGDLPIFQVQTFSDGGYGMLVPIDYHARIWVRERRYFGKLPLDQISGFRDEQTGQVITNAFQTAALDWITVQNTWQLLKEGEEAPNSNAFPLDAFLKARYA